MTEEHFRQFAGGFSAIVWRMSPDGTRMIAPRWAQLAGLPESDLHRHGWLETVHPDERNDVGAEVRAALMWGAHLDVRCRIRFSNGTYHWFLIRGEPVRDERAEIAAWIGTTSNIDDQKRVECALAEKERWLRMVLQAARVGTIDHDLRSGHIEASPAARSLLGLSETEPFTFRDVRARLHPDDRSAFHNALRRATQPGADGSAEIVFRTVAPDGETRWVTARGTYLCEGEGDARRAVRFVGVAGDLSGDSRDMAERAQWSALVSSSEDAIFATTETGEVTHWNAAAERMFGYTVSEIVGQSVRKLVPPDRIDEFDEHIKALCAGQLVTGRATQRTRKDGKLVDVSLTLSPIRDDRGRRRGISAICHDIGRQRELQAELAHAQKMEAVGQLAGGVAHDLNNTLTAVLVGVELAARVPGLDDETRANLGEVHKECFRAAGLIRELLAVAKRQVIHPRACSLNATIEDSLSMIERIVGESVATTLSLRATRGVFVDPAQLNQVMLNLASNARDAMAHGGSLVVGTRDGKAGEVEITVTDTGCGMSPEVQARVFEPFFSTKGPGAGSGLGLSTTYGIIAQSNGRITVQSMPGVGTTFTIVLPSVEEPRLALRTTRRDGPLGGTETILLVEDDRAVRDQIARALRDHGYDVVEARNGVDALSALQHFKRPVDLVFSDVVMPEMNGVELVSTLRGWYPKLRALFMSGYSERAVAAFGVVVEDTELLEKPFELVTVVGKVRELLDRPAVLRRSA